MDEVRKELGFSLKPASEVGEIICNDWKIWPMAGSDDRRIHRGEPLFIAKELPGTRAATVARSEGVIQITSHVLQ